MQRQIPLGIAFFAGLFGTSLYFTPHPAMETANQTLLAWLRLIYTFAMLLGIFSITRLHVTKLRQRKTGWWYSAVVIIGLFAMILAGRPWDLDGRGLQEGTPFMWIFQNIQVPMDSTMFSLLAFFIASAAFRTFRARTPEATLLLVAAVMVMLGRVPLGHLLTSWLPEQVGIPALTDWILTVPNLAAKRGIMIGVGLGSISTALKVILGIERTYLGGGK
ncbi:hypothetical protein AMJ39_00405 [candidate division TA06 bacterium DG_24]|uniref:Uncharacterized protein n=3 Tax=Bacteria division TA06 TaxID=1156500 RepID=A0A0S8JAL7_UNCT6|nr:MAG: hypothetical protein AMJ39_00405 [candidate division TA06 bacterium DG_24]KPK68845.1 MAG: hypothetical protein AMJ82_07175 [candidate division TA06 bacterium SM23_40]KPL06403.1 MAG: hypothetical protein AMJ71_09765 [candidate division TA06 bacterium SM1_40]